MPAALRVEFCGEWFDVDPETGFSIGRTADLAVDDNPYLHRKLVQLSHTDGLWWLSNVGSGIALTVSDRESRVQALLSPETALPLVFSETMVRFSAGPTMYEVSVHLAAPPYTTVSTDDAYEGETTIGRVPLTDEQELLLVALAERALRRGTTGVTSLPSSAEAADRLGWPLTTFNRRLDHLCNKLARAGVPGLHGDSNKLASSRRARLVEHALSVRLIEPADVSRLP